MCVCVCVKTLPCCNFIVGGKKEAFQEDAYLLTIVGVSRDVCVQGRVRVQRGCV